MALALIVALGGAWRLLEAKARYHEPLPFGDEYMYFVKGLGLREGRVLGDPARPWAPSARRAPLFPALISAAAGEPPEPGRVRLLQAALSVLSLLLTYAAGALAHSRLAGVCAAGLAAASPALAASPSVLNIEAVYGFLVLLAGAAFARWAERPDAGRAAAAGLAVAAALTCRSNLFAAPLAAAAWALRRHGKRAAVPALVLLACAYLPLAPWTLRNARWLGRFVPLEDKVATHVFYLASAGAVRGPATPRFSEERTPLLDEQVAELMEAEGAEELVGRMRSRTVENVLRRPWVYLWAWARRCPAVLAAHQRQVSAACLALAVVGLRLGPGPATAALYALLAYCLGLSTVAAFLDRHLLAAAPLSLCLAGIAVAELARRLGPGPEALPAPSGRRLAAGALAAGAAAASLLYGLAVWRLFQEWRGPRAVEARSRADQGWRALEARSPEAAAHFEAAAALLPRAPEPALGLGLARAARGDPRALSDLNAAIGLTHRPWTAYVDDASALCAAAALEARARLFAERGRAAAAASDAVRAARLRRIAAGPSM